MSYQINVKVDPDHSVDPSYIVHYRITQSGALVHSGIIQHHRHAEHNQIPSGEKIPRDAKAILEKKIQDSVAAYMQQNLKKPNLPPGLTGSDL